MSSLTARHLPVALLVLAVLMALVPASHAAAPTESEARAALRAWMTASSKVKSVTADFEQLRNLRNVRRPLRKSGKLWMVKEGEKFRWQIGDPPRLMVVRGADGGMTVLDVEDRKAKVWSRQSLLEQEKEGRGQGFSSIMEAMQTPSLAEFEQRFTLEAWKVDATNPAWWDFEVSFKDRRTSLVVRRLTLAVNRTDGSLRAMTLQMRDGSSLATIIRSYTLNQAITPATFQVSTEGYQIERE